MRYNTDHRGYKYTHKYRVFATGARGRPLSYWHDIPLHEPQRRGDGEELYYNFVCEIPKHSRAKMEVAIDERLTPIKQDVTADGQLRYYPSRISWNYGMLPRTWEDPAHAWPGLDGLPGDGDPLDVVEIGSGRCHTGGVYGVKVLGALALIDDGEVDWKLIAVRRNDALAPLLHDVPDMEQHLPGELARIHDWFRDYKVPQGKPRNAYGFGGHAQSAQAARAVIEAAHRSYGLRAPAPPP